MTDYTFNLRWLIPEVKHGVDPVEGTPTVWETIAREKRKNEYYPWSSKSEDYLVSNLLGNNHFTTGNVNALLNDIHSGRFPLLDINVRSQEDIDTILAGVPTLGNWETVDISSELPAGQYKKGPVWFRFRPLWEVTKNWYTSPELTDKRIFAPEVVFANGKRAWSALHTALWYQIRFEDLPSDSV